MIENAQGREDQRGSRCQGKAIAQPGACRMRCRWLLICCRVEMAVATGSIIIFRLDQRQEQFREHVAFALLRS